MTLDKPWEGASYDFIMEGDEATCNIWRGFGRSKLRFALDHFPGTQTLTYKPNENVEVQVSTRPNKVRIIVKGGVFIAIADTLNLLPDSKNGTLMFASADKTSPYPTVKGLNKPFAVTDQNLGTHYWHNTKDALSWFSNELSYQKYIHVLADEDLILAAAMTSLTGGKGIVLLVNTESFIPEIRFYTFSPSDTALNLVLVKTIVMTEFYASGIAIIEARFSIDGTRVVFNYSDISSYKFALIDFKNVSTITGTKTELFSVDIEKPRIEVDNGTLAVTILPPPELPTDFIGWTWDQNTIFYKYYRYTIDSYVSLDEASFSLSITDEAFDIKTLTHTVVNELVVPSFLTQTDFNNRSSKGYIYFTYRPQNLLEVFHYGEGVWTYDGTNGTLIATRQGKVIINNVETIVSEENETLEVVGSPFASSWITENDIEDTGTVTIKAISLDSSVLPLLTDTYADNGKALLMFNETLPYLAFNIDGTTELTGATPVTVSDALFNSNISVRSR